MIWYTERNIWLIFHLEGSVYWTTFLKSGPAAVLAVLACVWRNEIEGEKFSVFGVFDSFKVTYAYSVFTFVLGFVLVFRCQLAYSRFWDGRAALEVMTNSWTDALIKSVVYGKYSHCEQDDIRLWRIKLVSLFSLLHATALSSLHDYEAQFEVIEGIDKEVSDRLCSAAVLDDVYIVYAWIQEELTMGQVNGRLAMPPPITTRIWQTLTAGMQGCNNAHMIHDTPFPFPYAQIIEMSLMILTATCGYMMANIMQNQFWVVFMTFVAVSGYASLNEIAQELEDPFGDDANDLPLQSYQKTINNRLKQFLYLGERDFAIPNASAEAYNSAAQYRNLLAIKNRVLGEVAEQDNDANKQQQESADADEDEADEDDEELLELSFRWVPGLDDSFVKSDIRNQNRRRRISNSKTILQQ